MHKTFKTILISGLLLASLAALTACGSDSKSGQPTPEQSPQSTPSESPTPADSIAPSPSDMPQEPADREPTDQNNNGNNSENAGKGGEVQVVAQPASITALVNKQYRLPEGYDPEDLVYPDVKFIFNEKIEKRMMRKEAAEALEKMFAGAKEDGIYLAGVSGYRSHATQKSLFQRYVDKDGEEKAKTYSAVPGHSEHETGLAIDVSGSDGKCAAQDCFGGTKEAEWLAEHAAEYGFIIRYPKGKEAITGYQYEPWHLRYVGDIAKEIAEQGLTLEEYYDAVPVSK